MDASNINTQGSTSLKELFREYLVERGKPTEYFDDRSVMVYDHIKQTKNGRQIRISEVINDIRTKPERMSILKENLPIAIFSSTIINRTRNDQNVGTHSGLIVIDIDVEKNPTINMRQLKTDLQKDAYCLACFRSPNGGVKVIFTTNISSISDHKSYFNSIVQYLLSSYSITEIDRSGSNISRACFLPYDNDAFFNIHASRYCLEESQLLDISTSKKLSNSGNSIPKPLLQVGSVSLEEHIDNMLNLLQKRTEVGLYANIFNEYRFRNLEEGIMNTSVPFLELIILKNIYPYELDWTTMLDEYYFTSQLQLSTDSLEGLDGLEVCQVAMPKGRFIKEHYRARTLGSISMKLIFNNPFCHIDYLVKEVIKINDYFCENPNPAGNPKPDDTEVRKIVSDNYSKFLEGTLDFSTVIRKQPKANKISKKYVFHSRYYQMTDKYAAQLAAIKTFHDARNAKNRIRFENAIRMLQDGKKITQKRIASQMALSTRTIRRYMTKENDDLILVYNMTINKIKQKR